MIIMVKENADILDVSLPKKNDCTNSNRIEMVEVFKTNVEKKAQRKMLLCVLAEVYPTFKINFDPFDCDKVLRVEGENMEASGIVMLVKEYGFKCEILD